MDQGPKDHGLIKDQRSGIKNHSQKKEEVVPKIKDPRSRSQNQRLIPQAPIKGIQKNKNQRSEINVDFPKIGVWSARAGLISLAAFFSKQSWLCDVFCAGSKVFCTRSEDFYAVGHTHSLRFAPRGRGSLCSPRRLGSLRLLRRRGSLRSLRRRGSLRSPQRNMKQHTSPKSI